MNKKRVSCLYRVSTLKQVEKNDIPMQKIACKEFINNKKDWIHVKDYLELGVSGYKLSEAQRDVLQDIKRDVLNNEFDVLLVFMFDRIGRREEETPFVVEWLIQHNVEVWSVKEGQRKIENRADKLINYLTYWQAGGESEKTAIRVREAQEQMAEKGILTYGGKRNAPYGFKFIKSGTFTKKGVERQKLIQYDEESKYITEIYEDYTLKGWGMGRIAKDLNDRKIKPKRGKNWSTSTIGAILENPIYMGYPAYNKKTSKNSNSKRKVPFEKWILSKNKIEEYVIVSEETWYKARKIRESRNNKENNSYNKPMQTKAKLLLIGLLKCGECGYAFMTSETNKKLKDGTISKHMYYKCSSSRFSNDCTAHKKSIKKDLIEEKVLNIIFDFLDEFEKTDLSDAIKKKNVKNYEAEQRQLKTCEQNIYDVEKELNVLKGEIVKSLEGTSNFSPELLNELIEEKEAKKDELLTLKSQLEITIAQKSIDDKDYKKMQNMIPVWKEEFEKSEIEIKKMLLSEIIKEIRVYNDKIEIDFLFEIKNFLNGNVELNEKNEIKENQIKIMENTLLYVK